MGIVMKKIYAIAAVLALGAGSAQAADLKAKVYTKAPPPPVVVSPWDFAFGAAISSDYRFRGITQSNRNASVFAYFEPRYNFNENLQAYVGVAGNSISFTNRAAAEIDVYGGIRPTFGAFAFDFGVFGYLYPGGRCFESGAIAGVGIGLPGVCGIQNAGTNFAAPALNPLKKDVSFFEVYGKVTWTINDSWAVGAQGYYTPSFLNSGADGTYVAGTVKYTVPSALFGTTGIGAYVSGEGGYQFLGTTDAFYRVTPAPVGINYKDYATWNVGIGFTYKVFTLDLRYSDTNLNKGDCNAFTSDFSAGQPGNVTAINPGGFGSKWCGSAFIAKFSADLTAAANLK